MSSKEGIVGRACSWRHLQLLYPKLTAGDSHPGLHW